MDNYEHHLTSQNINPKKLLKDVLFSIMESATVSITDPKGNILYVNDRFCEVSKYTREELLGENHNIIKSIYHPKEY